MTTYFEVTNSAEKHIAKKSTHNLKAFFLCSINISSSSKSWYKILFIKPEVFFSKLAPGILGETSRKAIGDTKSYYFRYVEYG